jgi:hypothetical protein
MSLDGGEKELLWMKSSFEEGKKSDGDRLKSVFSSNRNCD